MAQTQDKTNRPTQRHGQEDTAELDRQMAETGDESGIEDGLEDEQTLTRRPTGLGGARTTTKQTVRRVARRTLGNLTGRPGLTRKAERLEVAIRAAIEHDQLGWLCGVLVDRGTATTGSRVPWATLRKAEAKLGIEWQGQTVSF